MFGKKKKKEQEERVDNFDLRIYMEGGHYVVKNFDNKILAETHYKYILKKIKKKQNFELYDLMISDNYTENYKQYIIVSKIIYVELETTKYKEKI